MTLANSDCNESIRDAVREYARELLQDSLENGDVFEMADKLREGIRQGWIAALRDIDTPEELVDQLASL